MCDFTPNILLSKRAVHCLPLTVASLSPAAGGGDRRPRCGGDQPLLHDDTDVVSSATWLPAGRSEHTATSTTASATAAAVSARAGAGEVGLSRRWRGPPV